MTTFVIVRSDLIVVVIVGRRRVETRVYITVLHFYTADKHGIIINHRSDIIMYYYDCYIVTLIEYYIMYFGKKNEIKENSKYNIDVKKKRTPASLLRFYVACCL